MNTPIDDVKNFYMFWDNIKTWRDFCQYDEHDPEEAEDRFNRRHMENENKALRKKHEKEERKRLIKLVDRAYKLDPRIIA